MCVLGCQVLGFQDDQAAESLLPALGKCLRVTGSHSVTQLQASRTAEFHPNPEASR